ncbi:hypothetical protein K491DRAFT_711777 [Lophiostoma macrostomum CBS 122681]|uniref:Uncharacterized protein n=1 Tax=Lophiostoma macrostomum CBS 122681 TaxID=1314788 RepID=A0A6A6TJS0_9PLEO|nr:hypothetical protein K491DRAFT_711777 [Lophiostoma macrostomum CBS 122681]
MTTTTARKAQKSQPQTQQNSLQTPIFPDQIVWNIANQVSQGAVINQAFYANFLVYFTSDGEGRDIGNKMTWLHRLPQMSSDGSNEALTLALRATASAYCGAETGNVSVLQDACRLYGQALQAHAQVLRARSRAEKEVTVHMVSTSVMLSLFEAMQATTAQAYCEHVNGAVRMIEVTGPGQCMEGVLCQLFFHIRTQMSFVYLTTRKPQPIKIRKILTENLEYRRLPIFQQLMTHIASLAEMYISMDDAGGKEQCIGLEVYSRVKTRVESLWSEYLEQAQLNQEQLFFPGDGAMAYRNGFTALTVAYFCAARILIKVLAPRFASSYPDFTDHFATVMECARFLQTKKIGCAYMRMATPLYLVSVHSPSLEQRRDAIATFQHWKMGSMGGISALALATIKQRMGTEQFHDVDRVDMPHPLDDVQLPMTYVGNEIPDFSTQEVTPMSTYEAKHWTEIF